MATGARLATTAEKNATARKIKARLKKFQLARGVHNPTRVAKLADKLIERF